MDPDETLRQLRELADDIRGEQQMALDITDNEQRFIDLFTALDQWLSKGNFLPDAWVGAYCAPPEEKA